MTGLIIIHMKTKDNDRTLYKRIERIDLAFKEKRFTATTCDLSGSKISLK